MLLTSRPARCRTSAASSSSRATPYYEILRSWIAGGAKLDRDHRQGGPASRSSPRARSSSSSARGSSCGCVATYADGQIRDVTREAFLESGNTEVATASRSGLDDVPPPRRGAVLARYEGAYAATTLTVMGDRSGFVWNQPPSYGKIDELVAAKWKRMKIQPSGLCTDAEFLRRVYARPDRPAADRPTRSARSSPTRATRRSSARPWSTA